MRRALLFVAALASASASRLFANVVSAEWLRPDAPMPLLDFELPADAAMGATTHFWATGGRSEVDDVLIEYFVDGEANASVAFTPSMIAGMHWGDQTAPQGNRWAGKAAKQGGWFSNLRVPFQKSLRVTARLPAGAAEPMLFYAQVRGSTDIAVLPSSGLAIPASARLSQTVFAGALQPLEWVDLVSVPEGDGVVFSTVVAVNNSQTNKNFMEGCHHLYSPPDAAWPGALVSSGMEDYYDSAFYFDAGEYYMPVSGLTHLNHTAEGGTLFAGFRYHDVDPLPFEGGMRLAWRNGDLASVAQAGRKCFSQVAGEDGVPIGEPGVSSLLSYGFAYVWPAASA